MFAATLLIALSHAVSSVSPAPNWQTDYATALKVAKDAQKSLVVVVGKGQGGWSNLSKTGSLSLEARKLLAEKYVCLYVDVEKSDNDRLARDFQVNHFPTLVVSDKTGGFQVHRQSGRSDDQVLETNLRRYVAYDLRGPVIHQSYYQPATPSNSGPACRG